MIKKLRKGNGILLFGVSWILIIFFLVIMFIEVFLTRHNAMNTQIAADSIADGVAVYMSYQGNTYTDAVCERDYLKSLINLYMFSDPTDTRISDASMDYVSLIENNVVDIKVTGDFAHITSFSDDSNVRYYTVHTGAQTEFTNYGKDILQTAQVYLGCLYDYGSSGEQRHEPSFFKLINTYDDNEYCGYGNHIDGCSADWDTDEYYETWLNEIRAGYRTEYINNHSGDTDFSVDKADDVANDYIEDIKDDVEYCMEDNSRMFDCSGFVSYVYGQVGGVNGRLDTDMIGDASNDGYRIGIPHVLPGDILLTNGGSHVVLFVEWEGNRLRCIGANGGDENTYANDHGSLRVSENQTDSIPCVKYIYYNISDVCAAYHYSVPEELFQ